MRACFVWLKASGNRPKGSGLFWDWGSLQQKPRSDAETEAFQRGLGVMASLYSSPLGTTVLQLKQACGSDEHGYT